MNGLPHNYHGRCEILCNDINPIVTNHNLVVLFALLNRNVPIEEAAELAVHLMYSSSLTGPMAILLSRYIDTIYDVSNMEPIVLDHGTPLMDPVVVTSNFVTRGKGKLRSNQTVAGARLVPEMFRSNYTLGTALRSMHGVMLSPKREDYRDRYVAGLQPAHRLGFLHFRKSGVLVPFSTDITRFTEPNRCVLSQHAVDSNAD